MGLEPDAAYSNGTQSKCFYVIHGAAKTRTVVVRPAAALHGWTTADRKRHGIKNLELEAPPGFEPGIEVLQAVRAGQII